MPIDIVIPCAGRGDDLVRLLDSLTLHCAASLRQHVSSITLTDDRHSEALGQRLRTRFPSVTYVRGPTRGPAANRNNGARQGRAQWLLFLDDDCYVETDLVAAYARRIDHEPGLCVFEGAIHAVGPRPNGNHHAPLNLDGGKLWSCNFALRREVFDASGGFDERFPFACMEDCDLHQRLRHGGQAIRFAPEAAVLHPWRSISATEVSRQIISHAIYADKHPDFAASFSLLNLMRFMIGRARQYTVGRFSSIPMAKYRTVAYDLAAPLMIFGVVRWPPLRRAVCARHAAKRH